MLHLHIANISWRACKPHTPMCNYLKDKILIMQSRNLSYSHWSHSHTLFFIATVYLCNQKTFSASILKIGKIICGGGPGHFYLVQYRKGYQKMDVIVLPLFNQWTQLMMAEWTDSALLVMGFTSSLLELMIAWDYGIVPLGKTHW